MQTAPWLVFVFALTLQPIHLCIWADLLSHLLQGSGFAEVILGTSTGLGFQPPNFPGNWKQVGPTQPQCLQPRLAWAPWVTGRKFMNSWSWLLFAEGRNIV